MSLVDTRKLVAVTRIRGDSEQDTALLKGMHKEAERYLRSFPWVSQITESYFGLGVGAVVAVFLFRIIPTQKGIDELLWVVVGDLPPAHLVTDGNPTPRSALEAYVIEMTAWVEAATSGQSVDELIPVNVAPTKNNAQRLRKRLTFLTEKVLPLYRAGD